MLRISAKPIHSFRTKAITRFEHALDDDGARKGDQEFRRCSTVTTFGTPQDVTLDELRIECPFPADEATAIACGELVGS